MKRTGRHKLFFLACLLAAWWGQLVPAWAASDKTYEKLDVFSQVLQYIQNSYVDEIDSRQLIYGAIRGMLKSLDPHSTFMTPDEFKSMQEDTSGHFGGIGVEIEMLQGVLTVVAPIDDTPAQRAGVMPGDQIVKIDGAPVRKMDIEEAKRRIKGVPGTKVVLTIDEKEES